ncbi:MAG TPA: peptidoglycan-associated lipoprotein Pal [Thermodesulfobacteriota bacterium]|nr:peptidoglycan-associated lipoprotein Pal [Thermodesulfobacteriota bacterium]
MKGIRLLLIGLLILALGPGIGCAKKTIRSDSPVYTPSRVEPGPAETRPEAAAPDKTAALEKEKKLAEESLREESLREKALREKALQEEAARREAAAREAASKTVSLEPVFFDFDQWSIREDQKEVMAKNSQWLKSNPNVKVRLEGHCDERGTAEYNLALGQKRAEGVKSFLEGLGISNQRMATISYGEERPLDPGHNEEAWAKNRRVDIVPAK